MFNPTPRPADLYGPKRTSPLPPLPVKKPEPMPHPCNTTPLKETCLGAVPALPMSLPVEGVKLRVSAGPLSLVTESLADTATWFVIPVPGPSGYRQRQLPGRCRAEDVGPLLEGGNATPRPPSASQTRSGTAALDPPVSPIPQGRPRSPVRDPSQPNSTPRRHTGTRRTATLRTGTRPRLVSRPCRPQARRGAKFPRLAHRHRRPPIPARFGGGAVSPRQDHGVVARLRRNALHAVIHRPVSREGRRPRPIRYGAPHSLCPVRQIQLQTQHHRTRFATATVWLALPVRSNCPLREYRPPASCKFPLYPPLAVTVTVKRPQLWGDGKFVSSPNSPL